MIDSNDYGYLLIRNIDQDIPIHFRGNVTTPSTSTLQFILDDQAWHSTILFDPHSVVSLSGGLYIELEAGVPLASLIGKTYKLFDWSQTSICKSNSTRSF